MPTILASAVISKARTILNDAGATRWTDPELLGWLNDGQREICTVRPDACMKLVSMALTAGTRQTIPSDGIAFVKMTRNMGAGGSTPGTVVRKTQMDLLDALVPDWHSMTGTATVKHYSSDSRSPKTFFVYPPSLGTTQVEVMYTTSPTDVAATSNVLGIDDIFEPALVDYLCYRAFMKDDDLLGAKDRAAYHRSAYDAFLGVKTSADSTVAASKETAAG